MIGSFSILVFLSVILVAFGYAVGNSKNFSIWKFALVLFFMIPFVVQFNYGKAHFAIMFISFMVGILLPHANLLAGFFETISNAINSIRYKDAYADIKRKEKEVEELRRKYEQDRRNQNYEEFQKERARRSKESQQHREREKTQKENRNHSKQKKSNQEDSSNESIRKKYLKILGLDPNGSYSFRDYKAAYRKQASKYHPDKHVHREESFIKDTTKIFQKIMEAFEWLGANT